MRNYSAEVSPQMATSDPVCASPFLKWAGGKRWAIDTLLELIPSYSGRYIEPFLGGGSLYFAHSPRTALLSDLNQELINAYRIVREDYESLEQCLVRLQSLHSRDTYYKVRARMPGSAVLRAARFIYLNRTCWNGLYRVNRRGLFNVPIGTKTTVAFEAGLSGASSALQGAELVARDFADSLAEAQDGDFVYVDPPYTVKHNNNGFVKYNESIFSWADQERLAKLVKAASERGVFVLVSNADHVSIKELYKDVGALRSVKRASVISGRNIGRGSISEVLIKCW